jgi:glucose/mannose-6-phosphate isomerase
MSVAPLLVLEALGLLPGASSLVAATVAQLSRRRDQLAAGDLARQIAGRIGRTIPLIYGGGAIGRVAALRWKCQVNENAKLPAFEHRLPEMDHNEIVGWERADEGAFTALFLEDCDQHPRERRRIELTAELIGARAHDVIRIETVGSTRTERLLWAVMLGDLLSLELAARGGSDPTPVEVIESLKDRLGRP